MDRAPLDYERHQVQSIYGKASTPRLAAMQAFCDAYGKGPEKRDDQVDI